jgi:hypothetical protein
VSSAFWFDIAVANGQRGEALMIPEGSAPGPGWFIDDPIVDLLLVRSPGPGSPGHVSFTTHTNGGNRSFMGILYYDWLGQYKPADGNRFPLWGGAPHAEFQSDYRVAYLQGTYSDPHAPGVALPWFAGGRECRDPQFISA